MRVSAVVAVLMGAAAVAAQNKCAAQTVLDQCVRDYQAREKACLQTDFICLCQAAKDTLLCYNTCPNDINKGTAEAKLSSWCVAADQIRATMTSSTPPAKTSTPASSSDEENSNTSPVASTETDTPKEDKEDKEKKDDKDSGAGVVRPALAMVAGVMALVAAF